MKVIITEVETYRYSDGVRVERSAFVTRQGQVLYLNSAESGPALGSIQRHLLPRSNVVGLYLHSPYVYFRGVMRNYLNTGTLLRVFFFLWHYSPNLGLGLHP
jgi:hypothetical protein